MDRIWENITKYYTHLSRTYHVNPAIFFGIHIVVTPIFIFSVAWLISTYRKKGNILLPVAVTILLFNISNIYLVFFGRNIPWFIYGIIAATTIISGYLTFKKIRRRVND